MRDPLRKVVSQKNDKYGRIVEVLECGHEQTRKEDIYGPTNAYRRRCRGCRPNENRRPDGSPASPEAFHQGTVDAVAEYVEHLRDDFQSTAEPVRKIARLIRERFKETA